MDTSKYSVTESGIVSRGDKVIKHWYNHSGYPCVTLWNKGVSKNFLVHRLVAERFLGSSDMHCGHLDGNKLNCHISNLKYVTPLENEHHKKEHGTYLKRGKHPGELNGRAKVTNEQAEEIRAKYRTKEFSQAELGLQYGISQRAVSKIVRGDSF